jgi:hypothetical protein
MENVIKKAQLYEDLFIEDETDILFLLVIEQTWITQILFNLEQRRHIPRQKTLCHSLTTNNF